MSPMSSKPRPKKPPPDRLRLMGPAFRWPELRGNCERVLECRDPQVLLSGPAGTGKSYALLLKLHLLCHGAPGCRVLIARKTRESVTETVAVTYEEQVAPGWVGSVFTKAGRSHRHSYDYPNGSSIVLGGLDKPGKIMSSDWDVIYTPEAIEITEGDLDALVSRLRHGRMPYHQWLGDTNPDAPTHWLKRRCDAGKTLMLETRHEDNPAWHDGAGWTPRGREYLAKLDSLSGPRLLRLRHGRWVQAEGVVYPEWDAKVHLVDRFKVPPEWPRYWAFDFGYTDPFVWQEWVQDGEGRLFLHREIVKTGVLVEDHARRVNALTEGLPPPRAVICDHDREGRATLEKYLGRPTIPAVKAIEPGLQLVAARLKPSRQDGRPRLFVMRGALLGRDPAMDEKKAPCGLPEEMDSYSWPADGKGSGRLKGEVPVDKDNHSADAARYLVAWLDRAAPDWRLRVL